MPAIPESTRSSILLRLLDHAEHNWPQLAKVQARYHGSFAYITGVLPGGEQIPLFRLRYGGSAHSFGFAIYSPARDRYEDAVLLTGLPIGSPQEALDTACTLHLAALGYKPESWPPTNLRCHPLSQPTRPLASSTITYRHAATDLQTGNETIYLSGWSFRRRFISASIFSSSFRAASSSPSARRSAARPRAVVRVLG